jgi:hypothetical protein
MEFEATGLPSRMGGDAPHEDLRTSRKSSPSVPPAALGSSLLPAADSRFCCREPPGSSLRSTSFTVAGLTKLHHPGLGMRPVVVGSTASACASLETTRPEALSRPPVLSCTVVGGDPPVASPSVRFRCPVEGARSTTTELLLLLGGRLLGRSLLRRSLLGRGLLCCFSHSLSLPHFETAPESARAQKNMSKTICIVDR